MMIHANCHERYVDCYLPFFVTLRLLETLLAAHLRLSHLWRKKKAKINDMLHFQYYDKPNLKISPEKRWLWSQWRSGGLEENEVLLVLSLKRSGIMLENEERRQSWDGFFFFFFLSSSAERGVNSVRYIIATNSEFLNPFIFIFLIYLFFC